ncbi:D-alanyl-D-alanine carboxypeptidase family protein [Streptomyces sp. NRRL F-5123]|uniref:D-alanyl-D-alanine carboxypeptidase family protein n=1 Tax=Streptomyces sp. NRRL F-5123 TaxID=1463856 RepID=UPI000694B42D|nr:D-alanyl-D-alanine carboxypeptidase [Streptomyces sp. NRRL F-5123]
MPESAEGPQDAASEPEDAAGGAAGAEDVRPDAAPADAPADASQPEDTGVHRAEVRRSLLRPLVSDLPAERPAAPPAAPATPAAAPAPGSAPLPPAASPDGADPDAEEPLGPDGTRLMQAPQLLPPGSGHTGSTPLKLLAALTNTPPPEPTLMRSIRRRFKIWTPVVVLLAVVFVIVQAVRPLPAPSLRTATASSYAFPGTALPTTMPWPAEGQSVAEVEGVGSLGVHGAQTPVPIASLTKVMTAYIVLRDHPIKGASQNGPMIPVDKQAAEESGSADESTAHVTEGQQFTERQMLQLLLVPSGNNIARLLARWDAGTQEAFVAKMTATAKQLGMNHTTYTGASGFEETTVSTAVDQLALAREVMKNEAFRSVVALANVTIPGVGTIYNNNNDLVKPGVVGIKTGSSTPAGGALMWAAHKTVGGKQQLILGVVLQQHGGVTVNDSLNTALARSQQLIESVQGGLTSATVVKKGEVVGSVDDGLGGSTPVVAGADLTAPGWPGLRTPVTLTPLPGGLPHSAKAGTAVGTLTIGSGPDATKVPALLQSDLASPSFTSKLTHF